MNTYQVGINFSGMEPVIIKADSFEQAAWTWIEGDFKTFKFFEDDSILAVYHEVDGDIESKQWELKFFLDDIESAKALAVLNLFKEKTGSK